MPTSSPCFQISRQIDLFDRIHAPEGDPRKITTETAIDAVYLNEDLSFADLQHLRKEVAELRTESGAKFSERKKGLFDAIKPSIDKSNPLMGKMDPVAPNGFTNTPRMLRNK